MIGAMFLAEYKKRLANVRTELVAILADLDRIDTAPEGDIRVLIKACRGIAGILVRVIDSIPG